MALNLCLLLALSCLISSAFSYAFQLYPDDELCFHESLNVGDRLMVGFQVQDGPDFEINFHVCCLHLHTQITLLYDLVLLFGVKQANSIFYSPCAHSSWILTASKLLQIHKHPPKNSLMRRWNRENTLTASRILQEISLLSWYLFLCFETMSSIYPKKRVRFTLGAAFHHFCFLI